MHCWRPAQSCLEVFFFYNHMMPNENSEKQILGKSQQCRRRVTFKSPFVFVSSTLSSALSNCIKNLQQKAFFFCLIKFAETTNFLKKCFNFLF